MRQTGRYGAVLRTVRQDYGFLREENAANGQVAKILAMVVEKTQKLAVGYSRLPQQNSRRAARCRDSQSSGEVPGLYFQKIE